MRKLESWLEDHIDEFYHLNNEEKYLGAVGVRGHQFLLKDKARKYLIIKANEVL